MLCFSVFIQPLISKISGECGLILNKWYANDGNLLGPVDAVRKALKLLMETGPEYQFYINPTKRTAYWPKKTARNLGPLQDVRSLSHSSKEGMEILGALVDFESFTKKYHLSKMLKCHEFFTT